MRPKTSPPLDVAFVGRSAHRLQRCSTVCAQLFRLGIAHAEDVVLRHGLEAKAGADRIGDRLIDGAGHPARVLDQVDGARGGEIPG